MFWVNLKIQFTKTNEIIMRVIISYNNRHLKYIKVFIKKSKREFEILFFKQL